jgi:hypothetical protein
MIRSHRRLESAVTSPGCRKRQGEAPGSGIFFVARCRPTAGIEPRRDRQLPETVAPDQAQLGFEHDRHHKNEHETSEGDDKVDGQPADGDGEAEEQAEAEESRTTARHSVPLLREGGVLLKFFFDLAKNCLFVL